MAPSPRIAIAAFALSRVLADWSCMLQAGNSLTGETTGPSSDPAAPITIWSRQAPAASDVISRGRDQLLVYIVDDTNSSSVSVVATWAANMSVAWVASLPPLTSGAGYTKTLVLAEWDGGRAMAHITNGFDSTLYEFALADGTSMRNISRSALVSGALLFSKFSSCVDYTPHPRYRAVPPACSDGFRRRSKRARRRSIRRLRHQRRRARAVYPLSWGRLRVRG